MNNKPEATNEMLAAFEKWVLKTGRTMFLGRHDDPRLWGGDTQSFDANPYSHPWTAGAWEAWQASRADAGTPPQPSSDNHFADFSKMVGSDDAEMVAALIRENHLAGTPLVTAYKIIATLRQSEEVQRLQRAESLLRGLCVVWDNDLDVQAGSAHHRCVANFLATTAQKVGV